MDTRRDFFKRAALLTGGAGLLDTLLPAIERAAAISPDGDSTYLDAEHVVILMQENRSFDHCFGTLRGVRGFNDPRAVTLPNQDPVWLQTNAAGEIYPPFRLDAQKTNATWLGGLPHSWSDQNDAKNHGDHDKWLIAKPVTREDCVGMPLTMGYYNREDLPFYYALADAFTICDQNFCSSLTGTTPNRLYLWTGTIREEQHGESPAKVLNQNVDYGVPAHWKTFPERLEEVGVSWKIYQNELSIDSGLTDEHDAWLTNFTDNPIEWFPQFAVEYAQTRRDHVQRLVVSLPSEIVALEKQLASVTEPREKKKLQHDLSLKRRSLWEAQKEQKQTAGASLTRLPALTHSLHTKAFCTNSADLDYRDLTPLHYEDGTTKREMQIPKGDVLYQFREDVKKGALPAVSWIVAPEKFSDHPGAAWYGAWYLAEVINILTHNPDVWKKTIFILTYDENDGFFDHVPPFSAPHPGKPETGSVSDGIDAAVEYVTLEQCLAHEPAEKSRGGSIGLGFRVPLLVASPWTRGGKVCSQVFDHTSVLQFLEEFATHKCGKPVKETNISEWRRTVCGDLSSVFQSRPQTDAALPFPGKDDFLERIHKAQFQSLPGYRALPADQKSSTSWKPKQEPGTRPACPIPYELHAECRLASDRKSLHLTLAASKDRFGSRAAGSPFHVYAPQGHQAGRTRSYAVKPGHGLEDDWQLTGFTNNGYRLCVHGPNGFMREVAGTADDPILDLAAAYPKTGEAIHLEFAKAQQAYKVEIVHHAYGYPSQKKTIEPGRPTIVALNLSHSFGWYDFSVRVEGFEHFERRYAGHVETGHSSFTDPAMGAV